jgi:hypothetical protein
MSTRYFNMQFWPAIGPAIWAAGLPLAFAADSSIRNQRIDCLPWASISACDDYGTCDLRSLQFRSFCVHANLTTTRLVVTLRGLPTVSRSRSSTGQWIPFQLLSFMRLRSPTDVQSICRQFTDSIAILLPLPALRWITRCHLNRCLFIVFTTLRKYHCHTSAFRIAWTPQRFAIILHSLGWLRCILRMVMGCSRSSPRTFGCWIRLTSRY